MAKTGIYGGSFDPVHLGHIKVAESAMQALSLDRVIFIPSGTPPHKMNKTLASAKDRFNMVKKAIEGYDSFFVSDIEINREKPCYSYETFGELKEMYPDDELYFIIGSDSLLSLHSWKNPDILSKLCTFIVVNREDESNIDEVKKEQARLNEVFGTKSVLVDIEKIDISSTGVRNAVREGALTDKMVSPSVIEYIKEHKLYR